MKNGYMQIRCVHCVAQTVGESKFRALSRAHPEYDSPAHRRLSSTWAPVVPTTQHWYREDTAGSR